MEMLAERGRRVTVEELNTTKLLAHARRQAVQRKYDDMIIVDCDAHHYENENYDQILPFMENDVLAPAVDRRPGIRSAWPCAITSRFYTVYVWARHALSAAV